MSLDVYLRTECAAPKEHGSGIFVRDNGATKEITREEWDDRHPGHEPIIAKYWADGDDEVYSRNITHNLGRMAGAAGIYEALWRPDEHGLTTAAQLVEPLTLGLMALRDDPEKFKALNPPNGWGSYEGLVAFVADYLAACERHPTAKVEVSR